MDSGGGDQSRGLTEREILIGILGAVMAVGEKLTGEKMLVKVPHGDDLFSVGLGCDRVKWFSGPEADKPGFEIPPEWPDGAS